MDATAFGVSFALAAVTVACLLPPALLAARALAWSEGRWKPVAEAAVALPLVLPPTVLGFYLLEAFGAGGTVGALWIALFGQPLAFSFEGLVAASLIANIPFAVQPMQRAFESIPANVREAAWVSGLSGFATFWRIELPLAWPGIVSAAALVFAHTLGEFGVVLMVGGNIPGETRTVSVAIYDRVQSFDAAGAGQMALVLLVLSVVAMAVVNASAWRRGARP